ncbi:MAG: low affinity iron permease family protein [Nocardioides sp.]
MDTRDASDDRKTEEGLSWFERFVESTYLRVSQAPFFFVIVAVVALWAVSFPLFPDAKEWQVVIHTVGSVLTLLLLVLLENASRRAEEASQEKLNVLAEALAALMESRGRDDADLLEAARSLREAVGLEERH